MNILPYVKRSANYAYEHMTKNPGSMFLITGSLGWILSSIAQVTAVVINKKIDKKEKKFLIPQEIADAAVNITSFYLLTKNFTKLGEHFVKTGRLATKELRSLYKNEKIGEQTIESLLGSKVSVTKNGKTKLKDFDISGLKEINDKSAIAGFKQTLSEKYFHFADGITFISSIVGSIISCSIVTPIVRNKIAAHFQKKSLMKEQKPLEPITPAVPFQHPLNNDNYKKVSSVNAFPSGSMKV